MPLPLGVIFPPALQPDAGEDAHYWARMESAFAAATSSPQRISLVVAAVKSSQGRHPSVAARAFVAKALLTMTPMEQAIVAVETGSVVGVC